MNETLLRFVIGGVVVSAFALAGDVLRPKSFAGLLGAAPSVALASLPLTLKQHGAGYVAIEGKSMVFGAVAFLVYAYLCGQLLRRSRKPTLVVTLAALPVWFGLSFGCLFLVGGVR
ncbi:MAG TPA: DUF3147 family protein [Acidobacteriaceae bacterium]|jgi:hypothetical protein